MQVTSCETYSGTYSGFVVATYYYHITVPSRQSPLLEGECIGTFCDGEYTVTVNANVSIYMTHETAREIAIAYRENTL